MTQVRHATLSPFAPVSDEVSLSGYLPQGVVRFQRIFDGIEEL